MNFTKAALPSLLASLAVAALATWLLAWHPFARAAPDEPAVLEIATPMAQSGTVGVSLDEGHGYPLDRPSEIHQTLKASLITVALPPGRICRMRVYFEGSAPIEIRSLRIRSGGSEVARWPIEALQPLAGTAVELTPDHALFRPTVANLEFGFTVTCDRPLVLPTGDEPWALEVAGLFIGILVITWLVLRRWPHLPQLPIVHARPKLTIALLAIASTLVSTYPVVFFGKSFVSPNTIAYLFYTGNPTIAQDVQEPSESGAGSDFGATMWQTLPYSVVESRALWHDHEFPLWNRYNSGGVPLLGQGLSMLGDPLHFIPLLGHGAWWAWDIKFVLAKMLFAIGAGLCAWSLTRRLGPSALLGASAAWIGFFAYRFNHPAFFGLCYAPWILLPWLALRETLTRRQLWLCAAGLLLADWCELMSGTAKEASMLLLCLNATGLLLRLRAPDRWRRLAPMLWASFLFLLLSAPAWLLFLDALRHAVTIYDVPVVYQMQPGLLIAFFDSIFSQDITQRVNITHPSANFFILLGVLWALWGEGVKRTKGALLAVCGVAAALVFGVVPPEWLARLPLIGRIQHIYNVFGCVLLVLLLPVAAQGWATCLGERDEARWRTTWWKVLFSIAGLFVFYLGFSQTQPASPMLSYRLELLPHSRFYLYYVPSLLLATAGLPWAVRWWRARRPPGLALAAVCLIVLHFRGGMYVDTKFDEFVMNPRTGMELAARSPALETVRGALAEPARVCGFDVMLAPGYPALLGLEGITGPDALRNQYYTELCAAAGMETAWGWRLMVDEETLPRLKRIYDMMNLRFYLREREGPTPALPGLTLKAKQDLEIYESEEAWPRAFFTDQCLRYQSPQQLASLVAEGDGHPFAATQGAVFELPKKPFAERQVNPAHEYRLTNNTTEFAVHATGPGLVVLAETYEEGNFEVTVDGRPAECLRVNHAFKGVVVDHEGNLRIRFTYWPRLLKPALMIALSGLLLALGTVALLWRARFGVRSTNPATSPVLGGFSLES